MAYRLQSENDEVRHYITDDGEDLFEKWLASLKDLRTQAKVAIRITRLQAGNFGDTKSLGKGLFEMRIDLGPSYRIYFGVIGEACILLLCAGDKRKQAADIRRAQMLMKNYKEKLKLL